MKLLNTWLKEELQVCKVPPKVARARTIQSAWKAADGSAKNHILSHFPLNLSHTSGPTTTCPACNPGMIKRPPPAAVKAFKEYQQRVARIARKAKRK